jgi:hypothetical protein
MSQILDDTTPVQVRSHRRAQWFWIDNAVLDTYGPTLGPIGLALYMSLCRHASSTTGKCWPSLERLSRQCGISVISASRHLKTLVACGLIQVEPRPGTTALITILDMPESPITEMGVPADPYLSEGTPPSESLDPPSAEMGEPDSLNQTSEPSPKPPEVADAVEREDTPPPAPLHTTLDALMAVWDEATRTRLYDRARATLVAERVSPFLLITPIIESRMVALWEAENQARGAPQGKEAA